MGHYKFARLVLRCILNIQTHLDIRKKVTKQMKPFFNVRIHREILQNDYYNGRMSFSLQPGQVSNLSQQAYLTLPWLTKNMDGVARGVNFPTVTRWLLNYFEVLPKRLF